MEPRGFGMDSVEESERMKSGKSPKILTWAQDFELGGGFIYRKPVEGSGMDAHCPLSTDHLSFPFLSGCELLE